MDEEVCQQSKQYLTFRLDKEEFAVEIHKVKEVLDLGAVTKIPATPEFMKGVINLRGNVVPVIDLRRKLGIAGDRKSATGCIIIAEAPIEGQTVLLGAIADSVQEVVEIEPDQIEPPPRIGTRLNSDFLRGMGKRGDRFAMILDIDSLVRGEETRMFMDGTDGMGFAA